MQTAQLTALAIHVCADIAAAGPDRRWPYLHAPQDTVQRVQHVCRCLGIAEQRTLSGEQATAAALLGALADASTALTHDGLLVLSFSGHTARGDGPIETARWCLYDRGVELSEIADHLARLPHNIRAIVICDSCYAAAIAGVLTGPQEVVVLASCGDDQIGVDRARSEFILRLEAFVCADRAEGSLAELRDLVEADTPDCERPVVWTNAAQCWSHGLMRPCR